MIAVIIYIISQNNETATTSTTPSSQESTSASPVASSSPTTGVKTVTVAEVAKHNSKSDCWVIISGKVYNVTSVIPNHPGGPDKIIPLCGKDATEAFTTRDGQGAHPSSAQQQLQSVFVGNLAS